MDPASASAKNLLVVVCDDMRPWFEPFSNSGVHAPNLHALAKTAMVFNNTYVQQAVCSPSRNSFMSGRRPDSTKTWNFQTSFRSAGVDTTGAQGIAWTAWPEAFKKAGYNTIGLGKVYHPQHPLDNDCLDPNAGTMAGCRSWSTTFQTNAPATVLNQLDHGAVVVNCTNNTAALQHCSFRVPSIPGQIFINETRNGVPGWLATCQDLPDANCTDFQLSAIAVQTLKVVAADPTRPFAMWVGFHKPHPFWDVPQRYQDLYLTEEQLPLPTHRDAPVGMPPVAYYSCKSLASRSEFGGPGCGNATLNNRNGAGGNCSYILPNASYGQKHGELARPSDELQRYARAGYAGGLTWTDLQIGKVLKTLDEIGKRDSTLVVFFADHGWALGENSLWCKQANFELETRVPLMIRAPWLNRGVGSTTAIVELIDLYPTTLELLGLAVPTGEVLEGVSLAPLLTGTAAKVLLAPSRAAFMQYPRCMNSTMRFNPPYLAQTDPCTSTAGANFTHMGYSIRVAEWRYTEWLAWECVGVNLGPRSTSDCVDVFAKRQSAAWGAPNAGVELYSHHGDDGSCFDCFERVNVAEEPGNKAVVAKLSAQLRAQFDYGGPRVVS